MNRTAADIQAEIAATQAEIAAAQARLADLETELADLGETGPTDEQRTAASRLAVAAQTIGPTAHRAADKGVITRRFNEALKVWGGDYAALRKYTLDYIDTRDDLAAGGRYLVRNHLAR